MKYLKIPTLSNWEPDAYQALKRTDPEINQLLSDFEKYEQAPSPMAKCNMLPALLKDLDAWKPPWGHEPVAWGALRDIVKSSITYQEGGIARKYDQVVCIGYKFNVGKFDPNDRGFSFNKSLATGETSATLDLSLLVLESQWSRQHRRAEHLVGDLPIQQSLFRSWACNITSALASSIGIQL